MVSWVKGNERSFSLILVPALQFIPGESSRGRANTIFQCCQWLEQYSRIGVRSKHWTLDSPSLPRAHTHTIYGTSWRSTDVGHLCSHNWRHQVCMPLWRRLSCDWLSRLSSALTLHPKVWALQRQWHKRPVVCAHSGHAHCALGRLADFWVPQVFPELMNWMATPVYVERASLMGPWREWRLEHTGFLGRFLGWNRFMGGQGKLGSWSLLWGTKNSAYYGHNGSQEAPQITFGQALISSHLIYLKHSHLQSFFFCWLNNTSPLVFFSSLKK